MPQRLAVPSRRLPLPLRPAAMRDPRTGAWHLSVFVAIDWSQLRHRYEMAAGQPPTATVRRR